MAETFTIPVIAHHPTPDRCCVNGCNGKGHYKSACPTANTHLRDGGKGYGGNGNTVGWGGKGYGGKGKGKGKGGKGRGNKGGLYELDLMSQWGGSWDQGYDQSWSQWGDDGSGGGYLRSLGCIDIRAPPDPLANSNADWLNGIIPSDVDKLLHAQLVYGIIPVGRVSSTCPLAHVDYPSSFPTGMRPST